MNATSMINNSFAILAFAKDMREDYEEILSHIPTGEWVRCMTIAEKVGRTTQKVSALLNHLERAGYANKRTVDDGIVSYTVTEWAPIELDPSIPQNIPVYDEGGNFVAIIPNPAWEKLKWNASKRGWREVTKYIHAFHSEFFILPF